MTHFFDRLWPSLVLWCGLYVSDYHMTLICARLYRNGVREKLELEGSYEITPYFQGDIDALRAVSPRFIAALAWTEACLAATWWFSSQSTTALYEMVFGAMVCVELAVHIRHFRNFFLFREITGPEAAQGKIRYSRNLSLHVSAVDLYGFAALFLVLAFFTASWFAVGGILSCAVTATKHLRLARKAASSKLSEVSAAGKAQ